MTMKTVSYGAHPHQVGDLYLPEGATAPAPVVCLLHGGFWRLPHGRDEMQPVALDLAARGFAVWNIEYRRVGDGGGWPATVDDVAAAIDHLATLATQGLPVDLRRVATAGHSAGGHLALWAAKRADRRADERGPRVVRVAAAVGLAPVADLAYVHGISSGDGAVARFLDTVPEADAPLWRCASPIDMLPLGVPQLVLHGEDDDVLPIEVSRRYAKATAEAGDAIDFIELEGAGHMEFLDPRSAAHDELCAWLGSGLQT